MSKVKRDQFIKLGIAVLFFSLVLLFVNNIITSRSDVDGLYIQNLRDPVMYLAYVLFIGSVLAILFGLLSKLSKR